MAAVGPEMWRDPGVASPDINVEHDGGCRLRIIKILHVVCVCCYPQLGWHRYHRKSDRLYIAYTIFSALSA